MSAASRWFPQASATAAKADIAFANKYFFVLRTTALLHRRM
jgi:hypothetical protein